MSIIAISGRIGSGKDEVGKIIKDLTTHQWEIKKFADSLKDTVCILLGCSREDLENHDFKNSLVSEEWRVYYVSLESANHPIEKETQRISEYYVSEEDLKNHWFKDSETITPFEIKTELFTVRKFLQILGTECIRNSFHGNTWVNALFSKYKQSLDLVKSEDPRYDLKVEEVGEYPDWIITDMRFPNELKAVKNKEGITIRINRSKVPKHKCPHCELTTEWSDHLCYKAPEAHPSETALDNAKFDYVIENNGTLADLKEKVKQILIKEKFI